MPEPARRDTASECLTRIQHLWSELQHASNSKDRARLEQQLRKETDAYKRLKGREFDDA